MALSNTATPIYYGRFREEVRLPYGDEQEVRREGRRKPISQR